MLVVLYSMTEQYIEELIRKYAEGRATKEEIQKLRDWYRFLPADGVQWPSTDDEEKAKVSQRMIDRLKRDISPSRRRVVSISWMKVAAALILCIGVGVLIYFLIPVNSPYLTITNPSGKVQLVNLPDGSKVWLNASSSLEYSKSFKEERHVKLDGEAYFEVTHDEQHPFKVDGGNVQTIVLGTRFNVKAYRSAAITSISLISGKVQVLDDSKNLAVLSPLTQLQFDRQNKVGRTLQVDTTVVQAWRRGKLQFEGETIADIAHVLENWYDIKITFINANMRSCRYYMTFDNTAPLEKVLAAIAETTEMQYKLDTDKRVVSLSGKACK